MAALKDQLNAKNDGAAPLVGAELFAQVHDRLLRWSTKHPGRARVGMVGFVFDVFFKNETIMDRTAAFGLGFALSIDGVLWGREGETTLDTLRVAAETQLGKLAQGHRIVPYMVQGAEARESIPRMDAKAKRKLNQLLDGHISAWEALSLDQATHRVHKTSGVRL